MSPLSDQMKDTIRKIKDGDGIVRVHSGFGHQPYRLVWVAATGEKIGGQTFDALVRRGVLRRIDHHSFRLVRDE